MARGVSGTGDAGRAIVGGVCSGWRGYVAAGHGEKIKEEMDNQRAIFVEGSAKHSNVSAERAIEIFDIIEKFAGYGFNKSHAAAYALVAYQTAWLKCNYRIGVYGSVDDVGYGQHRQTGCV